MWTPLSEFFLLRASAIFEQAQAALGLASVVVEIFDSPYPALQASPLLEIFMICYNEGIKFEAFYMATKSGGQIFDKVGSLEPGYYFDALVIDGLEDSFMKLSPSQIVERFCYNGETDNIKLRFLRGKKIEL